MIIRDIREDRGLSVDELAEAAGIARRTLQRIEEGEAPSEKTLEALADALDVEAADLAEELTRNGGFVTPTPDAVDEEKEARRYVKKVRRFYNHLFTYAVIIGFLFILNLVTSPGTLWFFWPALGWGLGIAMHAMRVFGAQGLLGKDWEERQIEKRLKR